MIHAWRKADAWLLKSRGVPERVQALVQIAVANGVSIQATRRIWDVGSYMPQRELPPIHAIEPAFWRADLSSRRCTNLAEGRGQ